MQDAWFFTEDSFLGKPIKTSQVMSEVKRLLSSL